MVKVYNRYEQSHSFATVTTPSANVLSVADTKVGTGGACHAIVAANDEILVWDVKKGELLGKWRDGEIKTQATVLAQSRADPDIFAVGYEDGTIRIWDSRTESVLINFNGHKSAITTLQFDPTGVRLASGAKDTDIIIWDLVAETGLFRLRGHKDRVIALHWLAPTVTVEEDVGKVNLRPDGFLLSASKDALVKLWDVASQRCVETHLVQTNGECWSMSVSNDGSGFITGGTDGEMKVWSIDLSLLQRHSSQMNKSTETNCLIERGSLQRTARDRAIGLLFHPTSDYFAVHGADKSLEIWRVRTEEEVQRAISRKRKRKREKSGLASGATEVEPTETDVAVNPVVADYFIPHMVIRPGGKLRSVAWTKSPSSKVLQIMTALTTNQIEVFDVPKQDITRKRKSEDHLDYVRSLSVETPGHRTDIRSLALSSDDRMLASASSGSLKIWNIKTGYCLRTLDCGYALCCAFLPGDKIVVVGTKSGELELFDISSSTLIEKLPAHENSIWTLRVHPDGKSLVTGSADKSAKFWNFAVKQEEIPGTKRRMARLQLVHSRTLKMTDDILSVCYSPDARLIAVSTLDNTVKVFFVDSLKLFLNLYGHKLPVLDLSISADSKLIATCSADKNVRIWGLDFGDCHKAFFAHNDSVMQVSFIPRPSASEETHYFFSASKDRTVKSWDGDKFEQIQRLDGHFGEIWAMVISKTGDFFVTAAHDKSIKIWNKTEEPIFLEEEREREMEALYESTVATNLDGNEADDNDEETQEAAAATKATIATLTAGERIVEALNLALEDLEVVAAWNRERERTPNLATPQRDPLFTALGGISAERYVLNTLRKIPASHLQDALLILSFSMLPTLFTFLHVFIIRQWEVSLVCRVLFFMVKTHHRQIVASRELKTLLDGMRHGLRGSLSEVRAIMGLNLAALTCAEVRADEHRNRTLEDVQNDDATSRENSQPGKKRAFMEVA